MLKVGSSWRVVRLRGVVEVGARIVNKSLQRKVTTPVANSKSNTPAEDYLSFQNGSTGCLIIRDKPRRNRQL